MLMIFYMEICANLYSIMIMILLSLMNKSNNFIGVVAQQL